MEFFFGDQSQPQQPVSKLFLAASRGNKDSVAQLIATEDPEIVVNGLNSLHIACKKNHGSIVDLIVRAHRTCVNSTSTDNKTGLMIAAVEGNIDIIKLFRELMTDTLSELINFQNDSGNSALHYCVWSGHEDCCKYLVEECGADYMLKNKDGMTPIQFAAAANHSNLVDYLSSFGTEAITSMSASGLNNLHRACMHGALETVVSLVSKQKMNPSIAALGTGNSPLHLAAKGGYNDIIRFLLEQPETNKDAQNKHGLTPLHFACNGGHEETTQLFLDAKCNTQLTTVSGATALHLAAGSGNHELCEVMTSLEHTDVSIEDENGQTAIDMALNSGYKELASKLAYWSVVASRSKRIFESTKHVLTI